MIGIATGGEIVGCIVSHPMFEPFERGPVCSMSAGRDCLRYWGLRSSF